MSSTGAREKAATGNLHMTFLDYLPNWNYPTGLRYRVTVSVPIPGEGKSDANPFRDTTAHGFRPSRWDAPAAGRSQLDSNMLLVIGEDAPEGRLRARKLRNGDYRLRSPRQRTSNEV